MSDELNRSPLIQKYRELLQKDPTSKVFAPLSEIYRTLGLFDKAIETLSFGLKANPHYLPGVLTLCECYLDRNKDELAFQLLEKSLPENRDNIKLLRLHAKVARKLQKMELALNSYKTLLFINPRDEVAGKEVLEIEAMISDKTPLVIKERSEEDFSDWVQMDFNKSEVPLEKPKETLDDVTGEWLQVNAFNKTQNLALVETTPIDESPLMTHTLVDLYCAQGHFDQAAEILEKMLELNSSDFKSEQRLVEVRKIISENNLKSMVVDRESGELLDEGRTHLMEAIDNISDRFDSIEGPIVQAEERFSKFLTLVKDRAKKIEAKYA